MKESRLYINWFAKNAVLILIPLAIAVPISYYLYKVQPVKYKSTVFLEIEYQQKSVLEKIAVVDNLVGVVRSKNLQESLDIVSRISVFKPAPLSLVIESENQNKDITIKDISQLERYIQSRENVKESGRIITHAIYPPFYLYIFAGFSAGLAIGILLACIKSYFNDF